MVLLFGCTHTKKNHLQWQCNSISREPKEFCYVPLEEWVASLRHFNLRGTSLEQQLRATEVWSFFQNPQWSFTVPPEGLQDRQHHSWHFCEPKVRRSEQGITKAFPFRCYVIYIYIIYIYIYCLWMLICIQFQLKPLIWHESANAFGAGAYSVLGMSRRFGESPPV